MNHDGFFKFLVQFIAVPQIQFVIVFTVINGDIDVVLGVADVAS